MFDRGPRDEPETPTDVLDRDDDAESAEPPIRCPKCRWVPRAWDRWSCFCGHAWNTFDTGGRCPACGEQWEHTQCLACTTFSPHEAWYVDVR